MKDLCFDARMLHHGGIGTYIRNLIPGLKDAGFRLRLIVHPKFSLQESWLGGYEQVFSTASIYSLREQVELPLLISSSEVFFSPHYNIPLAPIRAKKRVVTIHDVCHLALSANLRWFERLYARQVLQQAVRRSNVVITDSAFSLSEICAYVKAPPEKIEVVHCGVDHRLFQKSEDQKRISEIVEKFKLPSRYFLFVGNLKPHKNIRGLLRAMEHLIQEFGSKDVSMVIVGTSEGMKNVEWGQEIYKDNPLLEQSIHWLSSVSNNELPILYQLAQALVFPSYYEGFGLPALEAMSCGCPVIASTAASLPEVCGSSALYVSPEKPLEIASAMNQILTNEERKQNLITKGLFHTSKFTWKKAVQKHVEILERVIRGN